ncbi:bifunctional UDP-N-acetylglucosamine diphosphorylase/glucosamine-1-phosphate N-acetyltransferase GlmU [Chengkuizengella axinellae]|uniref:Bifunctional protein GlmU n=1 Tax=Chengkuizengella axinellae TaxID=3064388 RepID=A0ABT9J7G0_9BACL|nr:bifunctional UDP-N-acetylglucosamine diphosphorylase/glucosamine-1-phosphate N-acetyltransferase GlmU [Chengkuizengella sp. 2205SS18-9]MDP5276945.1 bifunctional UDP-N-acetylglucosamine diphosphorylase/glucosamine-1-phosphate N-acetyltransferase GlmU [Chengkuizengella sp. 2205SS18-9]
MKLLSIVLAAGKGTRMKSKKHKVLHPLCGKPMVGHVIDVLKGVDSSRIVTIIGHGGEEVRSYLGDQVEYVLQEEQLGTGHAVMQAKPLLKDQEGITIVTYADAPLITPESLKKFIEAHKESQAAATILTAELDNPYGYGRIVRGSQNEVTSIVEQKDCSPVEREIKEINTGTYCVDNKKLFNALDLVTNNNVQGEYYLTDIIRILKQQNEKIEGHILEDANESFGINDRVQLADAEKIMRGRILKEHMRNGVTIIDPSNTYVDSGVTIGMDTTLMPGTKISENAQIGSSCTIGPQSEINNTKIGDYVTIKQSVVVDSTVGNHTTVGPFAYLRPGSNIGEHVKIGDFVEIKNATIDDHSKVSHLSYVGDAKVGQNVNIGCGAVTVNYDGFKKHLTEIEDEAFVGSNVNLIAPIKVGKGSYVVAGSTLTEDIEADSVAIARVKQTTKEGYASKLKSRIKNKYNN